MKQFLTQFNKEFRANFNGFSAYIIIAAYYILSLFSALYLGDYFLRESEIMNAYFIMQPVILTLVIPATTMRTWADEAKSGTLELLLTQPIGYFKLVLAKFFAAYAFFFLMAAMSLFLFFVSDKLSILDTGLTLSGYAGLLLCGALFTAAGCLVSALSRNNILSYIAAIFVLFFLTQVEFTSAGSGIYVFSLRGLNFEDNYKAFLSGVLTWSNLAYFIIGTCICLWLNTAAVECKRDVSTAGKKQFAALTFLMAAVFACSALSAGFFFNRQFDFTDEKKFTLSDEDTAFLKVLDKRINITLYEAGSKRMEANSGYAVYAEFAEKILKLIERQSNGAVRIETVMVEPFSQLEHRLTRDDHIWFEEDKFGQKTFMAAELSDNEGNRLIIPYFGNLRQNLLETDLIRTIRRFGQPQKRIAVAASKEDMEEMQAFRGILDEFYDVQYLEEKPVFIPNEYAAAIIINPTQLSTETLLAMEQYVLNGGSLIIFSEPKLTGKSSGQPIISFLKNFGITPIAEETISYLSDNVETEAGAAEASHPATNKNIRSVLFNGAGSIDLKNADGYHTLPVLKFTDKTIAALSFGKYFSNYLNFAVQDRHIEPASLKEGKVIFIYDSDLLKDYLYVSEESKGFNFYQIIPAADNLLFLLRLMDYAANGDIERHLSYRHYALNKSSIGNAILANINKYYEDEIRQLENNINLYKQRRDNFYDVLNMQGYASIRNIGDIGRLEQNIDESETRLYKIKSEIAQDYQTVIMGVTILLILAVPAILLVILGLGTFFFAKYKQKKIRRLADAAKTS